MDQSLNEKLLARMSGELAKPQPSQQRPGSVVEVSRKTLQPVVASPDDYAPPDHRPDTATRVLGPLPKYVTHAPDAPGEAKIAAHAIIIKYEAMAQQAEETVIELTDRINEVIQRAIEDARMYRERGAALFRDTQAAFALVEEAAKRLAATRELILGKNETPPPEEPPAKAAEEN